MFGYQQCKVSAVCGVTLGVNRGTASLCPALGFAALGVFGLAESLNRPNLASASWPKGQGEHLECPCYQNTGVSLIF